MHPKMIWLVLAIILFVPMHAGAQGNQAQSLITQRVDDSKLTVLKGNTHPSARTQFDRGAAPASLPMERMLLVLKRSPEQQAALDRFLAELGDKSSPNYHKWLTPEKFGQEFGPSEGDIQTVTSWLESHGFQIGEVAKAHNVIEFSGTAGQVEGAFHTSIHKYVVNGEEHWANSSDPQIPTALVPVVVGVKSLHNFLSKPLYHSRGTFTKSKSTGEVKPVKPSFTFADACGLIDTCYALAPYDFATIYNVLPLWNAATPITGTGESIGIVGRVTVNIADMENFRIFVGLPAKNPVIIVNGTAPGANEGDEGESDLDMQWAGGVAKDATIDFVTSASTNTTDGVDLSAEYILNNNLTPILSYSYGLCEAQLGVAGNAFSESLWEQAVTQGITVLVATGDTGSSICEDPLGADDPGTTGLAVNGIAATPNNVAVGGTDFDDWNTWGTYWASAADTNATTLESALSYIPEMAYNDTCTNFVFGEDGYSANLEANCNNPALASYTSPFGGGGGASTVYTKPAWQTGVGVPADGARDLPDLSLFAGDGTIVGSAYVVCQADTGASCVETNQGATFDLVGGTSVSTQVFAGIMALVDQKADGREGNANLVMYPLAVTPAATSCDSSSSPSSTCYFYDVTLGTNAMPCVINSLNCTTTAGDTIGITETNGVLAYNAGVGYDLATGLGSVNAENFVNAANWTTGVIGNPNFTITSSAPTVTIASPGSPGTLSLTITSVNGYTGTFNLSPAACSGLPAESACSFSTASVSVSPGSTTANFTMTITTTAPSAVVPANKHNTPKVWPVAAFALSCLLALSLLVFNARGSRRWSTALALVVFGLLISISACGGTGSGGGGGGGSGGTPTGTTTGTVTITDVAGTTTHSFSFTLTVN